MATHAIGPGTRNLFVNVPAAEAAAMGRAALAADLSLGEYCRRLWRAGARWAAAGWLLLAARWESAQAAERLAEIDRGLQP